MNSFELLTSELKEKLKLQNIIKPTPIQEKTIPVILQGKDVVGTAQTGTGKTLAFLLPLLMQLEKDFKKNALILAPTRELAQQIQEEISKLVDDRTIKSVLIVGGDNIHKQFALLRSKPRIIVATVGRLIDHLQRKSVELKNTKYLVLDETDRMLDMGFIDDIRRLLKSLPSREQTLLFSATLPAEITSLIAEFLNDPCRIKIGSVVSPTDRVLQEIVKVDIREKLQQLLHELATRQGSILIFCKTKHGSERLVKQLKLYGQKVNALHGDLRQNRRRQVLEQFKDGTMRVLVATDVAARGIDVPHIEHVINYDLPQCPEDYIHRIGRTGRAGAIGNAISFITDDEQKWKDICKVAKFVIPIKIVQKTIDPLPTPKFVAQEEGSVHAKRKNSKSVKVSKATELAKKLLAEGEVYLPQREELENKKAPNPVQKQKKKVQTFRKATQMAEILQVQENPFHTVKVGVSKKNLKKQANRFFIKKTTVKNKKKLFKK